MTVQHVSEKYATQYAPCSMHRRRPRLLEMELSHRGPGSSGDWLPPSYHLHGLMVIGVVKRRLPVMDKVYQLHNELLHCKYALLKLEES